MPKNGGSRPKPPPEPERQNSSPEGVIIERARRRIRPTLSQRKAAQLAGISEAGWRQNIDGWRWDYYKGVKQRAPHNGKADTVARMALVVGLEPKDLGKVRPDVSAAMIVIKAVEVPEEGIEFGPAHIALALQQLREFCGDEVFYQALRLIMPPPTKRKAIPLGR